MEANQLLIDLFTIARTLLFSVTVLLVAAFLLLARTIQESPKPEDAARALFHYAMQGVSIILMSLAAIPTCMAALSKEGFGPETYLGLLIVFATGGILFLWNDQFIRDIDKKDKQISGLIYTFTLKAVGYLSLIFAVLYVSLAIALGNSSVLQTSWLVVPIVMVLYGSLLCWGTSSEPFTLRNASSAPKKSATKRKTKKKK